MAKITRRRRGELMRALFDLLLESSDGLRAGEALARLRERMPPTEYEAGEYANGAPRYEKVARFTTIVFVKSGWLVKDSGRWYVSEAGREAFAKFKDPEQFLLQAIAGYRAWKKDQPIVVEEELEEEETEEAGVTLEEAQEQAWAAIEQYLMAMPPYDFQELVAALLRAMGYHVGWIAPPGKDGGVDIVAFNDPLGTRPPRIKVQVKRHQARVSVDGLRSFMAVLGSDDVGIFVNAGGFTKDADEEARRQDSRRVTLLDLERLVALWQEHWPRLDEGARRRLPLTPVYFLSPAV